MANKHNPRQCLTAVKKSELFERYQRLARKLAARFAARYGIQYSLLCDEALAIMGLTVASWNTHGNSGYNYKKVAEMTWMYRSIFYGLMDFCTRKKMKEKTFCAIGGTPRHLERKQDFLKTLLETLGDDAKVLVTTILFAPWELAIDIKPNASRKSRKAIIEYFSNGGPNWDSDRIHRAWSEVQDCLAS